MYLFRDSLPKVNANIRFLHAIPDAPNVDIYLNNKLIYSNIAFGSITKYISVAPQTYNVQLYKSGTSSKPLISETIEVLPNSISTLNVTYEDKMIAFFTIDDTHPKSNPLLSFVRFINLAPTAPLLSLRLPEGLVLFDEASYLETNDYYPTSPALYNFVVSTSDGEFEKYINNIDLKKDMYITIYMIGLYNEKPPLGYILVTDGLKQNNK